MSTCLLSQAATATCKAPGNPTGTVDQTPGSPGGGGGTVVNILTPPGLVVSPPGSITVALVSDDRLATLIGFDEFMTPSTPPKKYRRKAITGSLAIDKTSANNTCASTNPGSGQQGGDFTVFYFSNEIVNGQVNCRLDSIDFVTNLAHYTYVSADWSEVLTVYADRATTPWFIGRNGAAVGLGSFSVTLGTTFTLSVHVQAIFGYGVGSWTYEAGRETFVDAWSQYAQYNAVSGVLSESFSSTRTPTGAAIPNRNLGVSTFDPAQVYIPEADLIVPLEPIYVSSSTDSPTTKSVTGVGCAPTVSGFGRASINSVGTITTQLSDEDLEDDAWARATPTLGTSNVARYELRGAGDFTFVRTDVTMSFTTANLQTGFNYRIAIAIVTADYDGSNPVSSTVNRDFVASASAQVITQLIQAARGKRVTIGTSTITLL